MSSLTAKHNETMNENLEKFNLYTTSWERKALKLKNYIDKNPYEMISSKMKQDLTFTVKTLDGILKEETEMVYLLGKEPNQMEVFGGIPASYAMDISSI